MKFPMATRLTSLSTFLLACLPLAHCQSCGYTSCPATEPDKLNIHIVAHTHDDVGWLKTVDDYYTSTVQYILNTVVPELEAHPDRKFIYVEVAFFHRWWRRQSPSMKTRVRALVNQGRLQFTLGHWSMPDEATTYYRDLITNAEMGMLELEREFGECGKPLVAWQIDPFGHSKGLAKLYSQMGFDALFLGRIDYLDYKNRTANHEMEFMWELDEKELFTLINSNVYWPPPHMCFDAYCAGDDNPVIQDDPDLEGYNVEQVVADFIKWVQQQHRGYATNHFLVTMGNDFNYSNANRWFTNIDKLITWVRKLPQYSNLNIFYSTPACYAHAVKNGAQRNHAFPRYSGDFFPYADFEHAYWTGYFTSKPAIKMGVSQSSAILTACTQWELQGFAVNCDKLRLAISVAQHHDGVSGTEKYHVQADYLRRLQAGISDAGLVTHFVNQTAETSHFARPSYIGEHTTPLELTPITLYNSLPWHRSEQINVPTAWTSALPHLTDHLINIEIAPLSALTLSPNDPENNSNAPGVNRAGKNPSALKITGLGSAHFLKSAVLRAHLGTAPAEREQRRKSARVVRVENAQAVGRRERTANWATYENDLGGDGVVVSVGPGDDESNLKVVRVSDQQSLMVYEGNGCGGSDGGRGLCQFKLGHRWMVYDSHPGNDASGQASGAYIFRPVKQNARPLTKSELSTIIPVQRFEVLNGNLELNFQINPLPVDFKRHIGKELILRITLPSASYSFFTDATNAKFMKRSRKVDKRRLEPTAAKYFPITSQAFLNNDGRASSSVPGCFEMTVDRSVGVASLTGNTLDIMLQRRCLVDDYRGLSETLNDTTIVTGRIVFTASQESCLSPNRKFRRRVTDKFVRSNPLLVLNQPVTTPQLLLQPLPPQVHLLTYETFPGKVNTVLVRLENLSEAKAYVGDLTQYLVVLRNYPRARVERLTMAGTRVTRLAFFSVSAVSLAPLEILTFSIAV